MLAEGPLETVEAAQVAVTRVGSQGLTHKGSRDSTQNLSPPPASLLPRVGGVG